MWAIAKGVLWLLDGFFEIIDKICEVMDAPAIKWYDQKPMHCGSGFRQRYANRELSLDATVDKFESLHKEKVDVLLVMCPNCQLQFDRSHLKEFLSKQELYKPLKFPAVFDSVR